MKFENFFIPKVLMLLFAEFVRGAFIISYLPSYAMFGSDISITIIGFAVSIHFICDVISNLLSGYLLQRVCMKLVVRVSFLFSSIGLLCLYMYPSGFTVVVAAGLLGLGLSPLWILLLSSVKENNRGRQMSYIYLGWLIGLSMGAITMNSLLTYPKLPVLLLLFTMVVSWFLYECSKGVNTLKINRRSFKREWLYTLSVIRKSKAIYPGILLQGMAIGILIPIIPAFVTKDLNMDSYHYSILLIIGGLATIGGLIPFGKLTDYIGKKGPIVVGFASLSAGIFSLTMIDNLIEGAMSALLIGGAYALLMPAWNSFMASFIPSQLEKSSWGLISSIQGIGGIMGPILGGVLAQQFTVSIALGISSLLMVTAAIYYALYFYKRLSLSSYVNRHG